MFVKQGFGLFLGAALAFLGLPAIAATPAGSYKINRDIETFDLNADATYVSTSEIAMTVLTEDGIARLTQADISYSSSMETITLLEAYTLKKDGTRIDVPAANIQDRDVIGTGGPMYSDFKGKVIIFPNLEVGDEVVYKFRTDQRVPMFPGQFSLWQGFDTSVVTDDAETSVSVPVNTLKLRATSRLVEGGQQPDSGGRSHWHWKWKNETADTNNDAGLQGMDFAPRILVSSFPDYAAIASAYYARAADKAAVTPQVRELAERLTRGVDAPREQARILYTWVARNIRYAGNCIGVGSVVPHDADMILTNHLGDCKDHTALLQALLSVKNIASEPVLVNSGASYELPDLPVPDYFNHVINYIPSLGIYADSTADFIPFGKLPYYESGKQVLPTAHFTGIVQTPPVTWQDYASHMQLTATISSTGAISGEVKDSDSVLAATGVRSYMASLEPEQAPEIVRKLFADRGVRGSGSISHDDPRAGSDPYSYGLSYQTENFMDLPGAGALYPWTPYRDAEPISAWVGAAAARPAKHDYRCHGTRSVEDYRYTMPPGLKVLWLPRDLHVATPDASYDAVYHQDGQTITVHRQLEYRIATHLCTPAEYEALRPLTAAVARDMRAAILYQMD